MIILVFKNVIKNSGLNAKPQFLWKVDQVLFFARSSISEAAMAAVLWTRLNFKSEKNRCALGLSHAMGFLRAKIAGDDAELARTIHQQLW